MTSAENTGFAKLGSVAVLLLAGLLLVGMAAGAANGDAVSPRPFINAIYADQPVEPTRFSPNDIAHLTSLDVNNYVRAITWSSWGGTKAVGQGQVSLLNGSSEDYETPPGRTSPVTVTLGGLRRCAGVLVYTTYSLQLAAAASEPTHWPKGQTGSFPCTPMVMSEFAAPATPRVRRRSTACAHPLAAPVLTKEEPQSVTVPFHPKPPAPTFLCYMRFHSWGGKTAFADGLVENLTNDHAARRNWPATVELSGRIWCPTAARGMKSVAGEPITYRSLKLTIYGPPRIPTSKTLSSFGHRGLKARVFWQHMHPTLKACQLGYSLENPFPDPAAAAGQG
jgi:hypothetical protein